MKITEKRLRKAIRESLKESWNKYGQPVQTGFQGNRSTNYGDMPDDPSENFSDASRQLKGWVINNVDEDSRGGFISSDDLFMAQYIYEWERIVIDAVGDTFTCTFKYKRSVRKENIVVSSISEMIEILEES